MLYNNSNLFLPTAVRGDSIRVAFVVWVYCDESYVISCVLFVLFNYRPIFFTLLFVRAYI